MKGVLNSRLQRMGLRQCGTQRAGAVIPGRGLGRVCCVAEARKQVHCDYGSGRPCRTDARLVFVTRLPRACRSWHWGGLPPHFEQALGGIPGGGTATQRLLVRLRCERRRAPYRSLADHPNELKCHDERKKVRWYTRCVGYQGLTHAADPHSSVYASFVGQCEWCRIVLGQAVWFAHLHGDIEAALDSVFPRTGGTLEATRWEHRATLRGW